MLMLSGPVYGEKIRLVPVAPALPRVTLGIIRLRDAPCRTPPRFLPSSREPGAIQIAQIGLRRTQAACPALIEAMVLTPKAPASLTDALAKRVPAQQVVEIMMVIGNYMLVCRLLETFEVDLEDADVLADVERWLHAFYPLMNPASIHDDESTSLSSRTGAPVDGNDRARHVAGGLRREQ